MKKTFNLTHPKKKYNRLVEAARNEVKKYLKRERNKELPAGFECWNFDCRFGENAEQAEVIQLSDIRQSISSIEDKKLESFYLEILAKPANKPERLEETDD
ncbi:MAG: DUF6172 family protein [Mariprofundaceae bacterium]